MKEQSRSSVQGFSLVEVTLALGVAAFTLMVILGLMSVGMGAQQTSSRETIATNLALGIMADLIEVPNSAAIALQPTLTTISSRYRVDVTQAITTIYLDQSGTLVPSAAQATFKATISVTKPAAGERTASYGTITISWPPAAVAPTTGLVTVFVALDRN